MSSYAVDLPGIEPTAADLAALEVWPWREFQEHIETLLAEQASTRRPRRAVIAPVRQFSVSPVHIESEGRAA